MASKLPDRESSRVSRKQLRAEKANSSLTLPTKALPYFLHLFVWCLTLKIPYTVRTKSRKKSSKTSQNPIGRKGFQGFLILIFIQPLNPSLGIQRISHFTACPVPSYLGAFLSFSTCSVWPSLPTNHHHFQRKSNPLFC